MTKEGNLKGSVAIITLSTDPYMSVIIGSLIVAFVITSRMLACRGVISRLHSIRIKDPDKFFKNYG